MNNTTLKFKNITYVSTILLLLSACGGTESPASNASNSTNTINTISASSSSYSSSNLALGSTPVPEPALASGYDVLTFSTDSGFNSNTVDKNKTYHSGYKWYLWNFFQQNTDPSGAIIEPDGSVSVSGGNGTLASAALINGGPDFVGTAFGGGGYFEATVSFDNKTVNKSEAWPSVWSLSLEILAMMPTVQWKGQEPGYNHYIEPDIFEYTVDNGLFYGSNLHDWYGVFNKTCTGYCDVESDSRIKTAPANIDWAIYNKVAMLWKPATDSSDGSVTFYLNGTQQGPSLTYSKFADQNPPPTKSTPWRFGILDRQHIVLVIGAGKSSPMRVQSFNVWQNKPDNNLTR